MGVREIDRFLEQWQMDARDLHRRLILAPTPRERERWHAIWPLAQGWTASATAEALKGAVQELPGAAGIGLANWNWKVVHQFVSERFGISLSRSGCLNYLHRLGFVLKRPKKRLVKADEAKRETFVVEYTALADEVGRTGGKIFFADEAHFRADAGVQSRRPEVLPHRLAAMGGGVVPDHPERPRVIWDNWARKAAEVPALLLPSVPSIPPRPSPSTPPNSSWPSLRNAGWSSPPMPAHPSTPTCLAVPRPPGSGPHWPLARQVPKGDARVILLSLPCSERVPPLILRLITRWRGLRSAALLSDGTSGCDTKTNNSLIYRSIRQQSLACTAKGSSRKGRHSASNRSSSANCPREGGRPDRGM